MTDYQEEEEQSAVREDEWYVSDLHLAAELGKTLLERNHDLEGNLKQQQALIEEQAQEIQFLSRQSVALKEVNDSRLRIYEQLEVSVSELEKTNQKLLGESSSDKKRIKSLCNNIEVLELKCEDLQKVVDELKVTDRTRQKRERNRTVVGLVDDNENRQQSVPEFNPLRRRFSIENGTNFELNSSSEEFEVAKMRATVSRLKCQLSREERKSVDLQAQVSLVTQENLNLQEQIRLLQEQQERLAFYHQAERLYWACHKCKDLDEFKQKTTLEPETVLDEFPLKDQLLGRPEDDLDCNKMSQRNCISLLSELDAQYRAVIEKYEDLLQNRTRVNPDEESDYDSVHDRCPVRTLSEEFSEASDLSSGFSSSSERSLTDQAVQTDPPVKDEMTTHREIPLRDEVISRKDTMSKDDLTSRHKGTPSEYKKLFDDIFTVIKRSPEAIKEPVKTEAKKKNKRVQRRAIQLQPQQHQFVCSPPPFLGFPVIRFPGGMTYAEVLARGSSKTGQPIFKPR